MMTKNKSLKLFFMTLILFLYATPAFALDCVEKDTGYLIGQINIPPLAVSRDTPARTKVWISDIQRVTAFCDNSSAYYESVYLYFNPRGPNLDPESGLEIGLELIQPPGNDLTSAYKKVLLPYSLYGSASGMSSTDPRRSVVAPLRFRLFVRTTKDGASLPSGQYTGPYSMQAFQFDGVEGINTAPGAKNLRYDLLNLRNIRFLNCGADMMVLPNNQDIDFGSVSPRMFEANPSTQVNRAFGLRGTRQGCNDVFSLDYRLDAKQNALSNSKIDLQNGLQLEVFDQGKAVQFGQYYNFGSFKANSIVDKMFNARLTKVPGRKIQEGPFAASLIYRINYK